MKGGLPLTHWNMHTLLRALGPEEPAASAPAQKPRGQRNVLKAGSLDHLGHGVRAPMFGCARKAPRTHLILWLARSPDAKLPPPHHNASLVPHGQHFLKVVGLALAILLLLPVHSVARARRHPANRLHGKAVDA